jgi:hypothetical protein
MRQIKALFALALALALAASMLSPAWAASSQPSADMPSWAGGVIGSLKTIATIGSTVDPFNGDVNPYGLTIAPAFTPAKGSLIEPGDLVVCNFNDSLNIQGLGTSIEVLSPTGAKPPHRLFADARLTGCAAIAMGGALPWVAALDANDNPIVSPLGGIANPLNAFAWTGPWGQAFVAGPKSPAAFYESNANDGSIVRINLGSPFTFETILTGFPVNHGVPGSILAPSGLTYDPNRDILYIVVGAVNALVAIHNPATIHAGGIVLHGGFTSGPDASRIKLVYRGAPLDAPISAALLFNGDIVVGNTGNNRLLEFTPGGRLVGSRLLDTGAAGALFGIAASGSSTATTRIYFNDDNESTVKVLAH